MTLATWAGTPEARILTTLFKDHSAQHMKAAEGQKLIAEAFLFPVAEYKERSQKAAINSPFEKLVKVRERVDMITNTVPDNPQAQLEKSLQLLKKYRKQNAAGEMNVARTFIHSALAAAWDESLNAQLVVKAELFECVDYFLSYTNKHADQTNTDFKKALYPQVRALCRTCNGANLLAKQIVEHLIGLSGYYDKDDIALGDDVRRDLLTGASASLVFLQLVSAAMLTSDEAENWCFQEYTAYKSQDCPRYKLGPEHNGLLIFLIAERPVQGDKPAHTVRPPADIREAYAQWYEDMRDLATTYVERSSCEKLREQIRAIAKQIGEFRDSVLEEAAPGEFAAGITYP